METGTMQKLIWIRFANAVSVGGEMLNFIDTSNRHKGKFELWLDDYRVRIVNVKTGRAVYSSLFNVSTWEEEEAPKPKRIRKTPTQEFTDQEIFAEAN
jgi:hypothetical protein